MRKSIAKRIRMIKSCRIYDSAELAREVGVQIGTIRVWRREGLKPIDPICRKPLFRGESVKRFLQARNGAGKLPLEFGQFFCPSCRKPSNSILGSTSVVPMQGAERFRVIGTCVKCGCKMSRFAGWEYVEKLGFDLSDRLADGRLCEFQSANVNTYIRKGQNHE